MASIQEQQLEDLHFRVLKTLEVKPDTSQRDLAVQLGISHGKMNYFMNALMDKGLVKLINFQQSQHKFKYAYLLTPAGIAEKTALTIGFLKRKMAEYETLKAEIDALKSGLSSELSAELSTELSTASYLQPEDRA
jgi:EPS-associated MarR family transcriptional regulator